MADRAAVSAVQDYLQVVRRSGIGASRAVLFGSFSREDAGPDSDIDILVIAAEFDGPYDHRKVDLLWQLRAVTDSRIEPVAVGERQWQEDDSNPLIEIARREGIPIT
ncbi:MAG: hypothetical protein AUJ96_05205 [Armatimonadetes bacterium CG2_30_66_41]|nr:MAG: hypothetical protein AUJ96_05205 [Armatimonadetes bacterium CG2_30_66_41]PIU94269.1 MAG: hypothetical protein COS65_08495 [Armatimonadetes bacterium CG06_land_8_20_14_3_00_66_21]